MPVPAGDNKEYIKYLRKELKAAKGADKKNGSSKEEKKMWWRRIEVTTALFFFSPVIAAAWIGLLELSIWGIKTMVALHP